MVGDVNSTVACALVASKTAYPQDIERSCRSRIPEQGPIDANARHGDIGSGQDFTHALRRLTLHRPSNVDDPAIFRDSLDPLLTIGGTGAARLSYPPQNACPH